MIYSDNIPGISVPELAEAQKALAERTSGRTAPAREEFSRCLLALYAKKLERECENTLLNLGKAQ